MRTLELFAGSQSFSKGVHAAYTTAECITVDMSPHFNPTHLTDLLAWDYTIYPPGHFDLIWGSPPCTQYSIAKTRGVRDLDGADDLVRRVFQIIDYFQPKAWIVENVGTGLLVKRMKDIRDVPMFLTDYCCYGKPVRKRTALWSNLLLDLPLCAGKGNCGQMINGRHLSSTGNGKYEAKPNSDVAHERFIKRNAIPQELIAHLLTFYKE